MLFIIIYFLIEIHIKHVMEKRTKYVIYVCTSQKHIVLIELSYSNSALKYADNEKGSKWYSLIYERKTSIMNVISA